MATDRIPAGLEWLLRQNLTQSEVAGLNPCVPGEFTLRNNYYVNTGTPEVLYGGAEESTLPLVAGRWYLLPASFNQSHADVVQQAIPVARARERMR